MNVSYYSSAAGPDSNLPVVGEGRRPPMRLPFGLNVCQNIRIGGAPPGSATVLRLLAVLQLTVLLLFYIFALFLLLISFHILYN